MPENRKPTFASPRDSSRHKYLLKKPTALPANLGPALRMNSMMRVVKSKLLEHFDKERNPESQISVMEKQIETLNTRVATYQSEHTKLKDMVDRQADNYNVEVQLKRLDMEIKDQTIKNQELKRQN